ncbi:MAG TPA: 50S ribosomal protein L24 [Chlamydiales bacterium]|nr:50S ribosomal protein L24 [Chlamydiales bacterium]
MMNKRIRKGDKVKVLAGNDKGMTGEVLGRSDDRVLVQGVNIRKKHLKRTEQSQGARIVEMEMPIHVSNVALCDQEGAILKLKIRQDKKSGHRELVYQAENQELIYRDVKNPHKR